MIKFALRLFGLAIGCLSAYSAFGLESDAKQPISIESDTMILDQTQGVSTYQGNVELVQGSIHITGNELIVHRQAGQVSYIEINGTSKQRAYFRQLTDAGEEIQGYAVWIRYFANQANLIMEQQVDIQQGSSNIRSNYIKYHTTEHRLLAGAQPDQTETSGRVRIVIDPKELEQ